MSRASGGLLRAPIFCDTRRAFMAGIPFGKALVLGASVLFVAVGCKKEPPPPAVKAKIPPSASVVASAVPAPSASVAEIPDAGAPDADAAAPNERAVAAGVTAGGAACGAFTIRPLDASPGLTFAKAVEACAAAGKFLCSDTEWQLACETDPGVSKLEAWTYSTEKDKVVVRGGGDCAKRATVPVADVSSMRATLCCDRAVGVTCDDKDAAQKVGATLVQYERGLREKKLEDVTAVVLEKLFFAGKELKREELLPTALAQLLPDAGDELTLFDSCTLKPDLQAPGLPATVDCRMSRLRASVPEEQRLKLATLGADYRLHRIELLEAPAVAGGEQKERVRGFLPSSR
jgi:hypothetical protein